MVTLQLHRILHNQEINLLLILYFCDNYGKLKKTLENESTIIVYEDGKAGLCTGPEQF